MTGPRTDDEPAGPYVEAPSPIPVQVLVTGRQLLGEVLGWRGERVYVRCRTELGIHLAWVPGAAVERVDT